MINRILDKVCTEFGGYRNNNLEVAAQLESITTDILSLGLLVLFVVMFLMMWIKD